MRRLVRRTLELFLLPAVLFTAWWVWSANSGSIYFPPLSEILEGVRDFFPEGAKTHLVPSLRNLAIGFAIAVVGGVGLGLWLGLHPLAKRVTAPVVNFLRSIPPPALLPVFIVLIGIGADMRIAVIAVGAVWPILLSTINGVERIESEMLDVASVFRLTPGRRLVSVIVPGAAPSIMAGIRTALGIGVILIVISEMYASTEGLGFYIIQAQRSFRIVDMWVGIVVIGLVGFLLSATFAGLQRSLVFWNRTGENN